MVEELDSGTNVFRVRWRVQNDERYVYYLARVKRVPQPRGVAVDYFWPEYTGSWAHSDGLFVNSGGDYIDMANWDEEQWHEDIELSPAGTVDVKAAVRKDGEYYWFEIRRELDSGDQWDWAVEPGDTVGFNPDDSFLFALIFEGSYAGRNAQLRLGK
jgi:hypothetical protein